MNIQQFQYILAVAELRHFEQAAEKCFISQSTLSTMIGRFEDEIGIKIFDRKTKPVSITQEGKEILFQLQIITKELDALKNKVQELKGEMIGELNIGIIPTVAPYILPLFLKEFSLQFPKVKTIVQEMRTTEIQQALKNRTIDIGIAAVPLEDSELIEQTVYNEPFLLFDPSSEIKNNEIEIKQIDYERLLLLEEGHCLHSQVVQICNLSHHTKKAAHFEFRAGSIDSLIRFTKANKGLTLLPYLATIDMNEDDKKHLRTFSNPVPIRSIGLLTHRHFVKKRLLTTLQNIIQNTITPLLVKDNNKTSLIKPMV